MHVNCSSLQCALTANAWGLAIMWLYRITHDMVIFFQSFLIFLDSHVKALSLSCRETVKHKKSCDMVVWRLSGDSGTIKNCHDSLMPLEDVLRPISYQLGSTVSIPLNRWNQFPLYTVLPFLCPFYFPLPLFLCL